jgi:hypothetical protein
MVIFRKRLTSNVARLGRGLVVALAVSAFFGVPVRAFPSDSFGTAGGPGAVDLLGVYEVQIAEDLEEIRIDVRPSLRTPEGRFGLHLPSGRPAIPPGTRVRVEGTLQNGIITVDRIGSEEGAAPGRAGSLAGTGETLGEQRTLVTLINFTNDPSEPYTISEIDWEILDETNPDSSASYYRETSYGRAWLSGSVLGWFPMGYDDSACNVWTDAGTQQVIDALDPYIDWTQVDRWIMVMPQNSSCGFTAISTSGKNTYETDDGTVQMSRAILNGAELSPNLVAAHELAHGFASIQHSADYECGDVVVDNDCNPTGLGSMTDRYDIMGHTWFGGHFSAPNKEQLDWFAGEVIDVAPPGGTFSLTPYETTDAGTKVLRIPVFWYVDDLYGTTYYYVSYRKNIGFDDIFTELASDGAMVHMDARRFVGGRYGRSRLLDARPHENTDANEQISDSEDVIVLVGDSFVDAAHGITVSVAGVTGGNLDVSVSITQYCGNGVANAGVGEDCDGADLAGQTCASIGYMDGILTCTPSCGFDTSLCGMARCGPDHAYGPGDACTAAILTDAEDIGLWRNRPTWTACRESSIATNFFDDSYLFFLIRRRNDDFTWIYRDSFPFDTSSIPDGRAIISADFSVKVLTSPGLVNSHPNSADQLILVRANLTSPPAAALEDFDQFGSLDNPVEGAPRIDVGESVVEGQVSTFPLNASGLSWIDPAGWTTLGIRGGFDVDNVTHPGRQTELSLSFRASDSPLFGPELAVTYASLALPGSGPAGAVPRSASVPGSLLMAKKLSATEIGLSWAPSCNPADSDFAVYEGVLGGDFSSHTPVLCSTNGGLSATIPSLPGSRYYLVVPRSSDREGSYGTGADISQRQQGTPACLPQAIAACGS